MRTFFFRLETLLKVRKVHESKMKREHELAQNKWLQVKEKEKLLHTQIAALTEEMQKKRKEGKLELQETYTQILSHLNSSLAQVQHNFAAHEKQLEEQKERLKQAVIERKVIEKIKEKHYAGWRSRQSQTEEALLDEISLKKSSDSH